MICVKMARIVCGDHYEPDHVIDIRGYAELVLKHIKQAVPSGSSLNEEPPDVEDGYSSVVSVVPLESDE